ncbi:hypothetical protein PV371_35900 [Streptomyces sp. TX20-6-3]|uniref:hypothetical protein n=1 Tax=Streptomyces sp. TX20-6-3 TaxID=3028705 RepID=UPI0029A4BBDC|nr:hypothetical protein [Streptomyces sp. TX20-6-3]MDX2565011.1 hypothetical protein [Streptomyces sp. TX20-6-3]
MPQFPSSDGSDSRIGCNSPESPPCSPWAQADAWHLVLTDVHELPLPIPAVRGQLGAWKPTQDLVDQVRLQLPQLAPESAS